MKKPLWLTGDNVSRFGVGFLLLFFFVQALLMGLNREGGNDLDQLLKASVRYMGGGKLGGYQLGFFNTPFLLYALYPLSFLPGWFLHAGWYLLSAFMFLHPLYLFGRRVNNGRFIWSAFLLVLVPFMEILQNHMLNAQVQLLTLGLLLYAVVFADKGEQDRAGLALGAAFAARLEAFALLPLWLIWGRCRVVAVGVAVFAVGAVALPFLFNAEAAGTFYGSTFGRIAHYFADGWPALHIVLLATVIITHRTLPETVRGMPHSATLYFAAAWPLFPVYFKTFSMVWLFPALLPTVFALYGMGKAVYRSPLLYVYLVTVGVYGVSRMLDEPRTGYLVTALFAVVTAYTALRGRVAGAAGDL